MTVYLVLSNNCLVISWILQCFNSLSKSNMDPMTALCRTGSLLFCINIVDHDINRCDNSRNWALVRQREREGTSRHISILFRVSFFLLKNKKYSYEVRTTLWEKYAKESKIWLRCQFQVPNLMRMNSNKCFVFHRSIIFVSNFKGTVYIFIFYVQTTLVWNSYFMNKRKLSTDASVNCAYFEWNIMQRL